MEQSYLLPGRPRISIGTARRLLDVATLVLPVESALRLPCVGYSWRSWGPAQPRECWMDVAESSITFAGSTGQYSPPGPMATRRHSAPTESRGPKERVSAGKRPGSFGFGRVTRDRP